MELSIKLLNDDATFPSRGSKHAAGLDLSASEDKTLWRGNRALIKTGLSIAIPVGYYGRIAPRSGLALRHGIDMLAGVIDADYRGEVCVLLLNTGYTRFDVQKGDRIAQLIIERIAMPDLVETDELPGTDRGSGGFGSTGSS